MTCVPPPDPFDAQDSDASHDDDEVAIVLPTVEIPPPDPSPSHTASTVAASSSSSGKTAKLPLRIIIPSPTAQKQRKRSEARRRSSQLSASSTTSASSSNPGSFPTPFKCCGDFCDLTVQQPLTGGSSADMGAASPKKSHIARFSGGNSHGVAAATALQLLFSNGERQIVGDHKLQQLLESMHVTRLDDLHTLGPSQSFKGLASSSSLSSSSSGGDTELRVLTYKSIALAKPNKQHLSAALAAKLGPHEMSEVPSSLTKTSQETTTKAQRRKSSLMDPTLAHALREGYRSRIFGGMDGAANLYRQVRVCRNCYAIYTLLDRARELAMDQPGLQGSVDKQIAAKRGSVKTKWDSMVNDEITRKEKLYLRSKTAASADDDAPTASLAVSQSAPLLALPVPTTNCSSSSNLFLPVISSPKTSSRQDETAKMPSAVSSSSTLLPSFTTATTTSAHLTTCNREAVSAAPLRANDSVVSMDRYLRGESKQIQERELREGQLFRDEATVKRTGTRTPPPASRRGRVDANKPIASVLLLDCDLAVLQQIRDVLAAAFSSSCMPYTIDTESLTDPSEALKAVHETGYDLILVARELQGATESSMSGLEFAKLVRQHEVQRSLSSSKSLHRRRTPILCLSSQTSAPDLQLYKDTGIDGCIGKPLHRDSLVQTVQAALSKVPQASNTQPCTAISTATDALAKAKLEQCERRKRRRRKLEAATALPLPFPGLLETDVRDYTHGTFQMDSETAFPFCVLGDKTVRNASPSVEQNTFFNLVVIHDLFDTWERLQILLNPIVTRYQGAVQILVWNYPGQAYTTWRAGTVLNNSYHCECFQALLTHVGPKRQGFLRDAPYYLLGLGNGGNIATCFASQSPPFDVNTRALVLVNAFSYVDAPIAQFLHDCLKVFACTPESRPDLPVYFHSRFLFSPAYVARVTAPLALNLYTAVMNPITLDGRKALCNGALHHRDLRADGRLRLSVPFVNICSAQNALVNVSAQTQTLMDATGVLLVDSIGKVLRPAGRTNGSKTLSSVVWLASGHEVLQECKHEMLQLLEQLVTGFHELHDVPHQSASAASVHMTPSSPSKLMTVSKKPTVAATQLRTRDEDDTAAKNKATRIPPPSTKAYEDTFVDRVLKTMSQVVSSPFSLRAGGAQTTSSNQLASHDKTQWLAFQSQSTTTAEQTHSHITGGQAGTRLPHHKKVSKAAKTVAHMSSWDPTTPAFERLSSNVVYKIGDGSKIYPDSREMPEVKEYMAWRVQRNHKRLQRMEHHVRVIQRAFRAFYARTLAWRLKRERCAVQLQRLWRAKLARTKYHGLKRDDWAVRLVQRQWRGKMGRNTFKQRMQQYLAATEIQRVARGALARRFVARVRERVRRSVTRIQRLGRQFLAKRKMFQRRKRRLAATTVQRTFRGHLGRKKFQQEKDKFLFSKTQSQGITFGKQMLLEYKLFGTKLQSEVALLTSTKRQVEQDAERVVSEICEFEEGVRVLEMEMHALAQLETEGLSRQLDEQAKWQLREQKMRLDREFTQMLAQIASRKETLHVLEDKLQLLDRERLAKEQELHGLERKLVILLDEQQRELDKIKHKQSTRRQLVLDVVPSSLASGGPGPGSLSSSSLEMELGSSSTKSAIQTAAHNATSAFSTKQREEAHALMESTETMMKFGFMSMSMTYFSSMNMVRAMRKIGAHHITLDSAAAVANKKWPEYSLATDASAGSPGFSASSSPMGFQPAAPPGSFAGQQPLQIAGWSVLDVGRWLDTLALGQYKRAFQDAAVDGALLLHLNDDDLKNTLGMEHRLHRKKVLTSVEQLREAEQIKMKRLYGAHNPLEMLSGGGGGGGGEPASVGSPLPSSFSSAASSPARSVVAATAAAVGSSTGDTVGVGPSPGAALSGASKVLVSFPEFCTLVRHGKLKQIKEALATLPERKFDPLTVANANSPGKGTVYDDMLEKSAFHVNKGDENGNSPLLLASQNNNLKVVQYLIGKGANPNHQNKHGQTAGHYAMAYSFFDLGAWLLDPEKGGGRDDIVNENGLTAYDGL